MVEMVFYSIDETAKKHESARIGNYVTIEAGCVIGEDSFIGHNCVLRPETIIGKRVIIGHLTVFEGETSIGDDVLIHAQCHITKGVVIENDVFIAPLFVGANDPWMAHRRRHIKTYTQKAYRINRAARIGVGVCILPGVTIGENAVIGTGAVVTKDVPDGEMWLGVPARFVKKVPKEEVI